jgi:hypothetical protein
MTARSIHATSPEELLAKLNIEIVNGFTPTLAFVFISIKQDRKAVCEILSEKGIDIFGATSCGEFIDGHQSEGEMAVLLLDVPSEYYKINFEEIDNRNIEKVSKLLAEKALQQYDYPSLIICSTGMTVDAEYFNGELMVKCIGKELGADKIFFGGMAGDDMRFTGTYVFTKEKETDKGLLALVFDATKINLFGVATTGWKPMGIARRVTKSEGNKLYTIDDRPAVEMYLKYLGREEKKTDTTFNIFEELGYTYPLITEREAGGEMVLRSPLKIDHSDHALVMEVEMPTGTKFWFSTPPDFDIVDEILTEAADIKNTKLPSADALLIFSCAGRPPVLGPFVTAENNGLAEIWQTPMAGFFTYGEYGRTKKGKQEFHSGACCWVTITENKS